MKWEKHIYSPGEDDRHFYSLRLDKDIYLDVVPVGKKWVGTLTTYGEARREGEPASLAEAKRSGVVMVLNWLAELHADILNSLVIQKPKTRKPL